MASRTPLHRAASGTQTEVVLSRQGNQRDKVRLSNIMTPAHRMNIPEKVNPR